MISTVYIEESIQDHPRTRRILQRFPAARQILCERYGEVFNPKAQNFRLQKSQPALILAEKFKNFVLEAPPGYGIGSRRNFYFSHMLNCLYDCRYCFLQGMYRSAHYVLFVNYEDYQTEIKRIAAQWPDQEVHFFSGYDCDSLALEPVTGFSRSFLPFFRPLRNAWLELRTKSTQIRSLLAEPPLPNVVVAYSLSPEQVARTSEHKAPPLLRRLAALRKLQRQGWRLGLRFDPLIYHADYRHNYQRLFETVFSHLDPNAIHSVSLGSFRLPEKFFRTMQKFYPEEKLFAAPLETRHGMVAYRQPLEEEMTQYCSEQLLRHIPAAKFFPCTP